MCFSSNRPKMRENRREPRKKMKEWAKIVLTDERTVYNCTVIDISPQGASLKIGIAAVPDHFFLFRKTDQTLRRQPSKAAAIRPWVSSLLPR